MVHTSCIGCCWCVCWCVCYVLLLWNTMTWEIGQILQHPAVLRPQVQGRVSSVFNIESYGVSRWPEDICPAFHIFQTAGGFFCWSKARFRRYWVGRLKAGSLGFGKDRLTGDVILQPSLGMVINPLMGIAIDPLQGFRRIIGWMIIVPYTFFFDHGTHETRISRLLDSRIWMNLVSFLKFQDLHAMSSQLFWKLTMGRHAKIATFLEACGNESEWKSFRNAFNMWGYPCEV